MRVTFITLLASFQSLGSALPSGGKENVVAFAQHDVVERQAANPTWDKPRCKKPIWISIPGNNTNEFPVCTATTQDGNFASVYSALLNGYVQLRQMIMLYREA